MGLEVYNSRYMGPVTVAHLPEGLYFISIRDAGGGISNTRFVRQ